MKSSFKDGGHKFERAQSSAHLTHRARAQTSLKFEQQTFFQRSCSHRNHRENKLVLRLLEKKNMISGRKILVFSYSIIELIPDHLKASEKWLFLRPEMKNDVWPPSWKCPIMHCNSCNSLGRGGDFVVIQKNSNTISRVSRQKNFLNRMDTP